MMTDDEVVAVLQRFTGAWPFLELSDQQIDAWLDTLCDVEPEDAAAVTAKAVRTLDRPPSIAWFLGEIRNEVERRREHRARELEPPVDPRAKAQVLDALREALSNPRPHDHRRGVASCPTCIAALERHIAEGCEHHAMHRRGLDGIRRGTAADAASPATEGLQNP